MALRWAQYIGSERVCELWSHAEAPSPRPSSGGRGGSSPDHPATASDSQSAASAPSDKAPAKRLTARSWPSVRPLCCSSAEWLRRSLVEKSCGKNILIQEAIVQKLDNLKAELEGSNPTPIERLLAERASICWFIVNRYENAHVSSNQSATTCSSAR